MKILPLYLMYACGYSDVNLADSFYRKFWIDLYILTHFI